MAVDLVIDIDNTPGALAQVAAAISDAGVNIAAATCIGPGERAELHILVPHAGAAKHLLGISNLAVTREREVVVVDVEDRPGVLADLTRRIARADARGRRDVHAGIADRGRDLRERPGRVLDLDDQVDCHVSCAGSLLRNGLVQSGSRTSARPR